MPRLSVGGPGGGAFWQLHISACALSSLIRPSCAMIQMLSGRMPASTEGSMDARRSVTGGDLGACCDAPEHTAPNTARQTRESNC